jgi:thioredoxin reductase (NADPH)
MLFSRTNVPAGSGCIAALEAEKFLAEQEDNDNELGIEVEVKKSSNVTVPEYHSNPLL